MGPHGIHRNLLHIETMLSTCKVGDIIQSLLRKGWGGESGVQFEVSSDEQCGAEQRGRSEMTVGLSREVHIPRWLQLQLGQRRALSAIYEDQRKCKLEILHYICVCHLLNAIKLQGVLSACKMSLPFEIGKSSSQHVKGTFSLTLKASHPVQPMTKSNQVRHFLEAGPDPPWEFIVCKS